MPLLVRCAVAGRFGRTLTIGVTCGGTGHACYRRTGSAVPGRELQDGTLGQAIQLSLWRGKRASRLIGEIWAQVEAKRRKGNGRGSSDGGGSGGVQAAHIYMRVDFARSCWHQDLAGAAFTGAHPKLKSASEVILELQIPVYNYKLAMNRRRPQSPRQSEGYIGLSTFGAEDSSDDLLGKPRDTAPKPSVMRSSRQLSILSLFLHLTLVAIHIALLVVWLRRWEHRLVFAVEQHFVFRIIKGILTTFVTFAQIYSALLVFVTQTLSFRRDLRRKQMLTATHDNAVAWTSLGSAVLRLWQQRAIPVSTLGVLSALIYLASILVLHTAFPALAAPESLIVNRSIPVSTQSLPAFNFSGYNLDDENDQRNIMRLNPDRSSAKQYAGGSLSFLPFLSPNNTLGLHEATLYDVLESNLGTGSVSVNATGFNISCGYIPDMNVTRGNGACPCLSLSGTEYSLALTDRNNVRIAFPSPSIFYTTIPVLDSSNNTGPWVDLTGSLGAQAIQLFRCSLTLVEQTAVVDSQSRKLTSLGTSINKTTSTWLPFSGPSGDLSSTAFANPQGFLNIWESWYSAMPDAEAPPQVSDNSTFVASALIQQLQLFPFNTTFRNDIYLHEVENELANIVASMFWTLGHVPPLSGYTSLNLTATSPPPLNVSLLGGQATVEELLVQERLDIMGGLAASIILLYLSVQFLCFAKAKQGPLAAEVDGVDMLQTIWLYRDHSELAACLKQVEYPTDLNLRQAGMVRIKLIATTSEMRKNSEAIEVESEDTDELAARYSQNELSISLEGIITLSLFRRPNKFRSRWNSDRNLSLVSIILHSVLLAIHLVLAIYSAGLIFLTQTLSLKRSLRKTQMLTVTHDTVAAWRGIGSALVSVLHQKAAPSSILGSGSAFLYLAGVLILHNTSPALLSVKPFNSNYSVPVTTQSLPKFTFSNYNPSSQDARLDVLHSPLLYARGTLFFLPFLNTSAPTLGLHGGTLYDVLESNAGTGNATVDATGFKMTCGYFADPVVNSSVGSINILGTEYAVGFTDLGIISTLQHLIPLQEDFTVTPFTGSAVFYSTVPILDSNGDVGPLVDITGMTEGAASIQIFGCSLELVNHTAIVDSQSRIIPIDEEIKKTSSVWRPIQETSNNSTDTDLSPYDALADDWESWYSAMPLSTVPRSYASDLEITVAEMFLIAQLNLASFNSTGFTNITLHQFENTLSELVASMYWTLGHVPPLPGYAPTSLDVNGSPSVEVSLLQGTAVVTESAFQARLDSSTSEIIGGAVTSAALLLLSLQFLVFRKTTAPENTVVSGMGMLHIIWLYRNHPELETQLEQVVHPTDANLRQAGMVRTRLAGSALGRRKNRGTETATETAHGVEVDSSDTAV
ncbi:hypothetical protein B0H13DRAFT_1870988 [Mycena leptocephala]|nr:hypothetical protein B0H13DRAFT_1870988 [Mycena leptocephala]